jgi:CxxC motif-containing protein (DUF1111 family)
MIGNPLAPRGALTIAACLCAIGLHVGNLRAQISAADPGPRAGPANAGGPAAGLGADETMLFNAARAQFQAIYSVSGGVAGEDGAGLGPTFNGNSCASCHTQPDTGGSSPHPTLGQIRRPNPQIALASLDRLAGRDQVVPPFITPDSPIREARFIASSNQTFAALDGTVHDLFTIAGRIDAPNCTLAQPDFSQQLANGNVVFRIPAPLFGLGLVENTPEATLRANLAANSDAKAALGIRGILNTSDDGTVTRFGWKAQGKSLLTVAAEHANVELGLSNEGSPSERSTAPGCALNSTPEDSTHIRLPSGSASGSASDMSSNVVNVAAFARLLAGPTPTTSTASELNGAALFAAVGCSLCHSTALTTGASPFPGQSNVTYRPYSDFALHHMGATLADGVVQGAAGPDMFRTAPLWGVGQRVFFLHDGRAGPTSLGLLGAIRAHFSPGTVCATSESFRSFQANGIFFLPLTSSRNCASEANGVIAQFAALSAQQQQDVLNFLRSL